MIRGVACPQGQLWEDAAASCHLCYEQARLYRLDVLTGPAGEMQQQASPAEELIDKIVENER